jgi:antitoxin ParD1/3/4
MPTVEKMSIALPKEMATVVRQAVATGEYASSSEVVRDALRGWNERRGLKQKSLKTLGRFWRQALEDKRPGIPMDEALDGLEKKYRTMADAPVK